MRKRVQALNPYEAIRLIEQDLRRLVKVVYGEEWVSSGNFDCTALARKRDDERGRRRAVVPSADLIDYTEFGELSRFILGTGWDRFAAALGTKRHMETYFSKIEGFRNPTMHSRTLMPFEEHLVLGISGELRNRIAIYMNDVDEPSKFYPVVEFIQDQLGNSHDGLSNLIVQTEARFEVGDRISFRCRATDPMDRDLYWLLDGNSGGTSEASGEDVELTYTFGTGDVGEESHVTIFLSSSGDFHRFTGGFDASAMFSYRVNPPLPKTERDADEES